MNKKRVLIVDDEQSVLYVLKNSLRKLGDQFQVKTAEDGVDALALLHEQDFDLVVTDYRMAGMDGLELLEAVREIRPHTRVILITAYGSEKLEAEARRLEAYRYLTKPLDIEAFRRIVKESFQGDIAVSRPGVLVMSDERYRKVMALLESLQGDVGGRCIILTDANGQVIARSGDLANLHLEEMASLLSGSMATLQAAGQTLDGNEDTINLSYREGERDNLYAINIGQQLLLILVIENSRYSSRLGSVWYYARQTAVSLRQTLGEAEHATASHIFDDDFDNAFDDELDKLFGDDDQDLFGETDEDDLFGDFGEMEEEGFEDEVTPDFDNGAFAAADEAVPEAPPSPPPAPQEKEDEPDAPIETADTGPDPDDGDSQKLMSFEEALAKGLLPQEWQSSPSQE